MAKYYFICEPGESVQYPEGTDDHTHFKEAGARAIAKLTVDGMKNISELSGSIKSDLTFEDIKGHWAEDIIGKMSALEFVQGTDSEHFSPDADVTRAEFLSMAMKTANIAGRGYNKETNYSDIGEEDWFRFIVQGAKEKELIDPSMTPDNKFSPDAKITRAEMASILVRVYNEKAITDVYAKKSVEDDFEYAKSWGFINGRQNPDGTVDYSENDKAARAEAAAVIMRMYDKIK